MAFGSMAPTFDDRFVVPDLSEAQQAEAARQQARLAAEHYFGNTSRKVLPPGYLEAMPDLGPGVLSGQFSPGTAIGNRLFGTGEPERFQTWPENLARSATTLPGDVASGAQPLLPPGLRREDYTDIPAPSAPTADSTWLGRATGIAPVAAQPNDPAYERAQDTAGIAGGGMMFGSLARPATEAGVRILGRQVMQDAAAPGGPLAALEQGRALAVERRNRGFNTGKMAEGHDFRRPDPTDEFDRLHATARGYYDAQKPAPESPFLTPDDHGFINSGKFLEDSAVTGAPLSALEKVAAPPIMRTKIIDASGNPVQGAAYTKEARAVLDDIAAGPKGAGPLDLSTQALVPDVPQVGLERYIPPRGISPRLQEALANPNVREGLASSMEAGRGVANWYHTEPVRRAFIDELGPAKGQSEFKRYMDTVAATSPRSDVPTNIRNASYYYQAGTPENLPASNPYPFGHLAQKEHRKNFGTISSEGGWDPFQNPKPASFAENLRGNLEPVTVDTHAFRNIGMRTGDPRFLETSFNQKLKPGAERGPDSLVSRFGELSRNKKGDEVAIFRPQKLVKEGRLTVDEAQKIPSFWAAKPNENEYAAAEALFRETGNNLGLRPADAQAAAWAGGGEMTGLGTVGTHTFPELMNERLLFTARMRGENPQKTLSDFIRGKATLLEDSAATGAPLSALEHTRTPEFKKWFEGSKAVTESGTPAVMYHGAPNFEHAGGKLGGFDTFDRLATTKIVKGRTPGMDNLGSWFTDKPGKTGAEMYAGSQGSIYPVHLNIKNPWEPKSFTEFLEKMNSVAGRDMKAARKAGEPAGRVSPEPMREWLEKNGYDGVKFKAGEVDSPDQSVWVALHPTQVKSATGNRGTFDPKNPSILLEDSAATGAPLSALERASQQGYDVNRTLYHGTSKDKDFNKFKDSRHGTWTTDQPAVASEYALNNDSQGMVYDHGKYERTNTASRVIPLVAKPLEKPFIVRSAEDIPLYVRQASNYKKAQSDWFDQLRSQGHDGVQWADGGIRVDFNNANLRSRAAKFDPAKSGKSGLLLEDSATTGAPLSALEKGPAGAYHGLLDQPAGEAYKPSHGPETAAPREAQPAPAPGRDVAGGAGGGDAGLAEAQAAAARRAGTHKPLEGLPTKAMKIGDEHFVPGPIAAVKEVAAKYMADRPKSSFFTEPDRYHPHDPEHATAIAKAFEEMKHTPNDPATRNSYKALVDETLAQYRAIKDSGLKIEAIPEGMPDPYAANPRLAAKDVADNNHLWFFPTDQGFGSAPGAINLKKHPMMQKTGETLDGRELLANDVFRVVHDYFGHLKEGHGFRAGGEDNAWRSHAAMYSDLARPAMTTETRGQNSWVNFGPHGEKNRKASAADTVYADQKVGLMPEWTMRDRGSPEPIVTYHGSPHGFDRFDMSKIGTGEGNQSFGHGLYTAENPKVAKMYRDQLSKNFAWEMNGEPIQWTHAFDQIKAAADKAIPAGLEDAPKARGALSSDIANRITSMMEQGKSIKQIRKLTEGEQFPEAWKAALDHTEKNISFSAKPGHTYQVAIDKPKEDFLDWNKPLEQQNRKIQEAVRPVLEEARARQIAARDRINAKALAGDRQAQRSARDMKPLKPIDQMTGEEIHRTLGLPAKDPDEMRINSFGRMKQMGIPGIRYLDQGSRGRGIAAGKTYNYVTHDEPRILKRYAIPGAIGGGLTFGSMARDEK